MPSSVDAVIAALKVVLSEAERRSSEIWFSSRVVNRWIKQLPGAWFGRWRNLKIRGNVDGEVTRIDLITHLRATIAYLEENRDAIERTHLWSWYPKKPSEQPIEEPLDVDFKDVPSSSVGRGGRQKGKQLHVVDDNGSRKSIGSK